MSNTVETVVVKRDGVDVVINKSDLDKEPKKAKSQKPKTGSVKSK